MQSSPHLTLHSGCCAATITWNDLGIIGVCVKHNWTKFGALRNSIISKIVSIIVSPLALVPICNNPRELCFGKTGLLFTSSHYTLAFVTQLCKIISQAFPYTPIALRMARGCKGMGSIVKTSLLLRSMSRSRCR